jgi:hypothetical protein
MAPLIRNQFSINGMNLGAIRQRRTDPLKADCTAATFSSAEAELARGKRARRRIKFSFNIYFYFFHVQIFG